MTTKRKTTRKPESAPKVKVSVPTPMKSRTLNAQLRSEIVRLATRNLLAEELKAAHQNYFTSWWELFRAANEQALNFWCCLPKDWQYAGYHQSNHNTMWVSAQWPDGGAGGDYGFEVRLSDLQDYVKLPANFHAFPFHDTRVCTKETKAHVARVHSKPYNMAPTDLCLALKKAKDAREELVQQHRRTANQIYHLLKEVKTTKQLVEVWPEGERFIPHEPVPVKNALSVDVRALTQALKAGGAL